MKDISNNWEYNLSPQEKGILHALMKAKGCRMSRTNLLRAVYHLLREEGGKVEFERWIDSLLRKQLVHRRKMDSTTVYFAFSIPEEVIESTQPLLDEEFLQKVKDEGAKVCPLCCGGGLVTTEKYVHFREVTTPKLAELEKEAIEFNQKDVVDTKKEDPFFVEEGAMANILSRQGKGE